jgi:hypothetical protein
MKVNLAGNGGTAVLLQEEEERKNETERNKVDGDATAVRLGWDGTLDLAHEFDLIRGEYSHLIFSDPREIAIRGLNPSLHAICGNISYLNINICYA